jgi:hypothetical protein
VVPDPHRINGPTLNLAKAIPILEQDPSQFIFDPKTFFSKNPKMLADFKTPSFFTDFSPRKGKPNTMGKESKIMENWHMLTLGGSHSGLPWHMHGATWIGLVFGKKQWFLLPPGTATAAQRGHPLYNAHYWINNTLPTLAEPAHLRCVQRPGEVLYLPAAWAHLTWNIGSAVAVGAQESWNQGHSHYKSAMPGAKAKDPEAMAVWAMYM